MYLPDQYTTVEDSMLLKSKGFRQDTNARWIRKKGTEKWDFSIGPMYAHNVPSPNYEHVSCFSLTELMYMLSSASNHLMAVVIHCDSLPHELVRTIAAQLATHVDNGTAVYTFNNKLGFATPI